MKYSINFLLGLMLAVASISSACKDRGSVDSDPAAESSADDSSTASSTTTPAGEASDEDSQEASAATDLPMQVVVNVDDAVSVYDQMRQALARDETGGLAAGGADIERLARGALDEASGSLQQNLQMLARRAAEFQGLPKDVDLAEARNKFGRLSEPMVGVIAEVPPLQKGLHVFQCPMAKGYKKWVQPGAEKANPYMGQKMPACGTATDWTM